MLPKNQNNDLKRQLGRKMEKLDIKTQKALIEILKNRK